MKPGRRPKARKRLKPQTQECRHQEKPRSPSKPPPKKSRSFQEKIESQKSFKRSLAPPHPWPALHCRFFHCLGFVSDCHYLHSLHFRLTQVSQRFRHPRLFFGRNPFSI